jgi:beta-aspartyl-peptidase (threonine type)
MSGYWKNENLTFISAGTLHQGWEGTRKRYIRRYQSEGREMGTVQFDQVQIRDLGNAAAAVLGRYRLEFSDGGTAEGRFTLLLEKKEEGWKIVHDHTSSAS